MTTGSLPSLAEKLAAEGVIVTALHPDSTGAPVISIPIPDGWLPLEAGLVAGAYGVWAQLPEDGKPWADNAILLVGALSARIAWPDYSGSAFVDSRRLPDWVDSCAETATYEGFPSAAITGTYTVDGLSLRAHTRYVLCEFGESQYLIQLTVTVRAGQWNSAIQAISTGLTIVDPAAESYHPFDLS